MLIWVLLVLVILTLVLQGAALFGLWLLNLQVRNLESRNKTADFRAQETRAIVERVWDQVALTPPQRRQKWFENLHHDTVGFLRTLKAGGYATLFVLTDNDVQQISYRHGRHEEVGRELKAVGEVKRDGGEYETVEVTTNGPFVYITGPTIRGSVQPKLSWSDELPG
jgi:hypothetical protein